jgi:beta-glucosidase
MTKPIFPKNFMWGASTAAHQVEGGLHNDWTVWELAHAKELARTAEKRQGWLPNWKDIKAQAEDPANYVSGQGVDHYHRFREDFDIASRQLHMNAFRFTIEWARLEPEEGQWDEEAVEHYRTYIRELRARKLEPFLNIWHWTVPVWFDQKGGFAKRRNRQYFLRFVQKISDEYGADLAYIITLNEPNVYTTFGYLLGVRPPQQRSFVTFVQVYWNLAQWHNQAYRLLKRAHPHLQVGIAAQLGNIQAKNSHAVLDVITTKWMRYWWNWWFMYRIRRHQDFVGINYYFTDYYHNFQRQNPRLPVNDLGWYMEPEGIFPLLLRAWQHFKKPIFITENGLADASDKYRRWWLEETIVAMQRAMSEGVDLRGYFHWSLLDNFEWESGWWPRFGLVQVDRTQDMKRTIRPSAKWLAEYLKQLRP